jgi:hypothetical protein
MSTEGTEEVVGLLRDGIERIPARVPPGLARRAYHRYRSRRTTTRAVAAAGTGAVAAVAAALVVTSAPAPGHSTAGGGAAGGGTAKGGKQTAQPTSAAVNPVLVQLAADITVKQVKLTGNATVEIRNQSPTSDKMGANGVDLYTDDGTYYWGDNWSDLQQAIAQRQDDGQGQFKRDIAAALYAVNGNIDTARARMAIANYVPGALSAKAEAQARQVLIQKLKAIDKLKHIKYTPPKPETPEQQKESTDSFIWMNATDALTAAPENPQVRAGVLRIMATMPNLVVTDTNTAGQATLTLTDSWPALSRDVEQMVINATTGLPVAMSDQSQNSPLSVFYYHPSRVNLADIEAGKF